MVTSDQLPADLILKISTHVEDQADLCSLVCGCRRLHQTLNSELYKRDVKRGLSFSLFWAARFGRRDTLERAYDAGANLEQAWVSEKSIFPDTCHFSDDQMPTTPFFTPTTKRHHIKYFKHSPMFYRYLRDRENLRPAASNEFNDNHPPVLRTASKDCNLSYPTTSLFALNSTQVTGQSYCLGIGGTHLTWLCYSATTT